MRQATAAWPAVKYSVTRLGGGVTGQGVSYPGGLDLTTPSLTLQPGALRNSLNYECSQSGGYGRIQGYERLDGRKAPSSATFTVIQFASFTNVPAVGNSIVQVNTGATGTIIAVNNVAGAYYIAVSNTVGTFSYTDVVYNLSNAFIVTAANPQTITAANPLTVSGSPIGTAVSPMIALSAQTNAQLLAGAADVYRALIQPVPGSGPVLGVVGMIFNGVDNVYAFRASNDGSQVLLYKASAAGWINVPFFNLVTFTVGTAPGGSGAGWQPADNGLLTQGGVSAAMMRVMWQSGTFTGNSAVGAIVVVNPTGGNFANGVATTSDGGTITLSGPQLPITLKPGGHFQFTKCNFSGQLITRRIYGCDGVNQCFEFDGVTLAPISTGNSPDAPTNITFHKNYLFISQAASINYCGVGTPFKWGAVDGGGEIATGDTVTGLITLPGSQTTATLAVYLRSNTAFLYGLDPTTFNFVTFNTGQGALPFSIQNLFDTFVFDDLGVVTLKTTLNWGNFLPSTLTKNILPFIQQERSKLIASSVQRSKSQYRVFFSDGYGLWLTMINQEYLGAAPVLFPNPVFCCDEGEDSTGTEITYFGSSDGLGYVYQMDMGTSFDGANIDAFATFAWDAIKSPRILKRFRAASIEVQSSSYALISFGYQLAYGTPLIGQPSAVPYASNFSSAPVWDQFTWDNFVWDGQTLAPTDVDVTGTGENIQATMSSSTNYIGAYNINSLIWHYTPRRGIRV